MSTARPLFSTMLRRLHLGVRREILDAVREAGHPDLTPAHLYVFQLPGPDGVRPTELAARMNMTKQAANHLLASLESMGYITREPVGPDGRARVVRMTDKGRAVASIMQESSRRIERRWARRLGSEQLERLRTDLDVLDHVVNSELNGN